MAEKDEHLLVEMWESKNGEWEKLTRQERQNILDQIGVGVGKLYQEGLQQVGFFVNNPKEGKYREHWQFVAVWKLPSKALLDKMLPQVEQLPRWFDVMNELRVWGRILDPITEGTEVLLNWGNENKPPTIMERFRTLERQVAEILEHLKQTPPETSAEQQMERLQTLERQVAEILEHLKQTPPETYDAE